MSTAWSIAFGIIGPTLSAIGALIIYNDYRQSRKESDKLATLRDYISGLDAQVNSLREEDTSKGRILVHEGNKVDIGETFLILKLGAEEANKKNRERLEALVDEVDAASGKRSRYVGAANVLVVVGTALWAAASFV
jgi:hypothetical protein